MQIVFLFVCPLKKLPITRLKISSSWLHFAGENLPIAAWARRPLTWHFRRSHSSLSAGSPMPFYPRRVRFPSQLSAWLGNPKLIDRWSASAGASGWRLSPKGRIAEEGSLALETAQHKISLLFQEFSLLCNLKFPVIPHVKFFPKPKKRLASVRFQSLLMSKFSHFPCIFPC
jgi:hypothetical protein